MKYYVYISDSKIDMLLSQIPHESKRNIATELKIDLKLLSASRKSEVESDYDRITKLEAVTTFIREFGNLGSIDSPDEYIEDVLSMRWGPYGFGENNEDPPLIYFGGSTEETIVGLGGSSKHLIGNNGQSHPHSYSATPTLVSYLEKHLGLGRASKLQEHLRSSEVLTSDEKLKDVSLLAVYLATEQMEGPQQTLEFMAKRLLYGQYPNRTEKRILLATPLYVALTD